MCCSRAERQSSILLVAPSDETVTASELESNEALGCGVEDVDIAAAKELSIGAEVGRDGNERVTATGSAVK